MKRAGRTRRFESVYWDMVEDIDGRGERRRPVLDTLESRRNM